MIAWEGQPPPVGRKRFTTGVLRMAVMLRLVARISTDDPSKLRPALDEISRRFEGTYRTTVEGFEAEFSREAESAREANRELLNELRRAVKKTRLRAQWIHGNTVERYFDYVPKGKSVSSAESSAATL